MGGEERKCTELLRRVVGTKSFDTWICIVTAVSEASCEVKRVFDNLKIKNVRLNATVKDNEGVIIYPAKNSYVLVTNIDNDKYFVSQFSEIEKITIDVNSNIVINGGKNNGLVKIEELNNRLESLENKYNQHTHPYVNVSTPATTSATTSLSMEFQGGYSGYENDKIKH